MSDREAMRAAVDAWSENQGRSGYVQCSRIVRAYFAAADAVEPSRHGRIVTRLMTFGGFQRTERGEFWVSRDDVLRLLEEELGADAVEGHRDQGTCRCGEPFGAHDSQNGACPFWLSTYAP